MSESTLWWIIAGFFWSLELLSGSLYLAMLGLGAATAAVGASLGITEPGQLGLAAGVGSLAVWLWHRQLLKRGALDTEGYSTVGLSELDLGEEVSVTGWAPDGTAHVKYRDGEWLARHHGPQLPRSGRHRILAIEPTCLVLEPV